MAMASRLVVPIRMSRMMSMSLLLAKRNLGTSTQLMKEKMEVHPGYAKMRAKYYEKYQKDDGIPVHLKGGPMDRILYITTLVLIALGLAGCLQFYYKMSFPKKPGEC